MDSNSAEATSGADEAYSVFCELATRLKMVSAWYMDKSDSDQRDEHKCDPHRPLSLEELKRKTGVLYFPVSDCMAALVNNTKMHNLCHRLRTV